MCVFRNMIVRSGVFVKSLMNIRTKKGKYRKMLTFFYLSATFCSYEIVFVIQSFTEYTLTC